MLGGKYGESSLLMEIPACVCLCVCARSRAADLILLTRQHFSDFLSRSYRRPMEDGISADQYHVGRCCFREGRP